MVISHRIAENEFMFSKITRPKSFDRQAIDRAQGRLVDEQ